MPQVFELTPKKWPKQSRSQATFEALIEACTLVLSENGYANTTTNHIADAAGVGIASLYEYFPGKDAIISLVIERLNQRVLTKLVVQAAKLQKLEKKFIMEAWLSAIMQCIKDEKKLIQVISFEVPYSHRLMQSWDLPKQLITFSENLEAGAFEILPKKQSKVSMYLIVNLVVNSITQFVMDPPQGVSEGELIQELSAKLNQWIFNAY